jgi:hypothetical protein
MDSALRLGTSLDQLTDRLLGVFGTGFRHFTTWRWWAQVLLVWALGRVFSLLLVLTVARLQGPNPWSSERPGYLSYIDGWDAGWYHKIFDEGYPRVLPRDGAGNLDPNQWAFYPVLPALAKLLNLLTGAPWLVLGPLISLVASLALCLLLYKLFTTRAAPGVALTGVALFSFQPAAPVLQFAYAESLGLMLLVVVLLCLVHERYWAAVPVVVLLSLTRPTSAPLALTMLLLAVGWYLLRREQPVAPGRWVGLGVLTVVTGLGTFLWPAVMGLVTGDPDAYFETEAAWHGNNHVLPGELWANIGIRLFGKPLGIVAPVVFVLGLVLVMATRTVRRLGPVLYLWTASYLLYLLGVIAPNGAVFRLMMPAFPLLLTAAMVSSSRAYRVALIVASLLAQVVWVAWLWHWAGVGLHGASESNP